MGITKSILIPFLPLNVNTRKDAPNSLREASLGMKLVFGCWFFFSSCKRNRSGKTCGQPGT